ncbi:dienelactone hydrolase family protein [Pantoea tagorei]
MKTEDNMAQKSSTGGFAPAVQPTASTTIHTDSPDIHSGETSVPSQGENMPAWYARPKEAAGPLPVVLVVQEIFGVHEHIRDICRRLALEGYLAVAPELYFREGDPNDYNDIPTLFSELVNKVPDSQVLSDLDHVANWAGRNGGDIRRMGITGFCWGGRISWLYAAHNPQLRAAVAWYGRLTGEKNHEAAEAPDRYRRGFRRAGAGPLRRPGQQHSAGERGADASGAARR